MVDLYSLGVIPGVRFHWWDGTGQHFTIKGGTITSAIKSALINHIRDEYNGKVVEFKLMTTGKYVGQLRVKWVRDR